MTIKNIGHGKLLSMVRIFPKEKISFQNITSTVEQILRQSKIKSGTLTIFSQHTTAGLLINEDEPCLLQDFRKFLHHWIPAKKYKHDDFEVRSCPPDERVNARSHLACAFLGTSQTVPINQGKMLLGKWQSIFFVDLDGGRKKGRTFLIQISPLT